MINTINEFFSTCPKNFDFVSFDFSKGGDPKIPMESELKLAEALQVLPSETQSLISLRQALTLHQAHQLSIFSVRMAILAARTNSLRLFDAALYGFIIDDGFDDWRDILRYLSIIEDCANRIGIDFGAKLEEFKNLMGEELKKTVFKGYLVRPPEMRTVAVMGFIAKGDGKELYYMPNF